MPLRRGDPLGISRWPVWSLPRALLLLLLAVEVLALGLVVLGLVVLGLRGGLAVPAEPWLLTAGVLTAAGIVTTEASLGVERLRRQTDEGPHIDLSSVWAFAAAALLPGAVAGIVIVIIFGYMYLRLWRPRAVPPHRAVFSTAAVVLAVQAAALVVAVGGGAETFRQLGGLLVLFAAMVAYVLVNMTLIVSAIVLSGPQRPLATLRHVLGRGHDAVLEFATLSLGALAAGAAANFGSAYVVLVLPPLIILHRAVLVRQLEEEANIDSKTGLLNAAAWDIEADRAVRRIERGAGSATVLVVDLDNFKQVNDEFGHLVGDQVLAAVAEAIRDVVRDEDLVGRFGGEEFVILLPAVGGDQDCSGAEMVANRIRRRVETMRIDLRTTFGDVVVEDLSVSIGGATSPVDGTALADLLDVADRAMYAAKEAGRNRVLMGQRRAPRGDVDGDRG